MQCKLSQAIREWRENSQENFVGEIGAVETDRR